MSAMFTIALHLFISLSCLFTHVRAQEQNNDNAPVAQSSPTLEIVMGVLFGIVILLAAGAIIYAKTRRRRRYDDLADPSLSHTTTSSHHNLKNGHNEKGLRTPFESVLRPPPRAAQV
ncbi:hypothetical protein JAAARDRAFT_32235 [Jaapia argillacea MUCL 33604]|uniref:Gram-positive cocci surface proteins LPxTG domain-containing protein n=1 Tax=Jaapia argillacea MUCL 33604 TaxID=933084 RepID=A0A067Q2E1_9AGAM|nr:hypothetical protein JAAARDRAFT_32235 [Jaapia argillacea MUCL 33604]